eukprot:m.295684 g.295684  ORF g.295684 m.295684 type:complete len:156 (-) comp60361_c0_seq1:37-504(-)
MNDAHSLPENLQSKLSKRCSDGCRGPVILTKSNGLLCKEELEQMQAEPQHWRIFALEAYLQEPASSHLQCSVCQGPLKEARANKCGHTFCKGCLLGYLQHSRGSGCPMCRMNPEPSYHPPVPVLDELVKLHAKRCQTSGCDFWGFDLDNHARERH